MDTTTKLWWKAFLSIAYGSGLEILHLTWADVDLEQHHMEVRAKKTTAEVLEWDPKNHKNRVVPMSDESAKRKYYLAVRPEDFDSASKVLNLVLSKTQSD